MKKVLRVIFIIFAIIMGIVTFMQLIFGDFELSSITTLVGLIVIANLFKDNKKNENEENKITQEKEEQTSKIPTTSLQIDNKTIMVINEIYTLLGEGTVVLGEVLKESVDSNVWAMVKTQNGKVMETTIGNFRQSVMG